MKNWYKTNIEFSFKEGWEFPTTTEPTWWVLEPEEIASQSVIDNIKNNGFELAKILLFYCPPNCSPTHAHVDFAKQHEKLSSCAFNCVMGGETSKMVWYNPLTEYQVTDMPKSDAVQGKWPKYLLSWQIVPEELTEIESLTITGNTFTMVRVNLPHAVFTGNEARWCVSLRLKHETIPTWESMVNTMRNKNLLDE